MINNYQHSSGLGGVETQVMVPDCKKTPLKTLLVPPNKIQSSIHSNMMFEDVWSGQKHSLLCSLYESQDSIHFVPNAQTQLRLPYRCRPGKRSWAVTLTAEILILHVLDMEEDRHLRLNQGGERSEFLIQLQKYRFISSHVHLWIGFRFKMMNPKILNG